MIKTSNDISFDIKESAQVCVIGSGAGGAVVAKELQEYGYQVVLLEEGGNYTIEDFTGDPGEMLSLLYRSGGSIIGFGTPPMPVPLGRCLGGTTTINSATCFTFINSSLLEPFFNSSIVCKPLKLLSMFSSFSKIGANGLFISFSFCFFWQYYNTTLLCFCYFLPFVVSFCRLWLFVVICNHFNLF